MIIVEEKNKKTGKLEKHAYATNEEFDENDANLAEWLAALYSKRWGIESSFDVEKNSYLAKTASKNYSVRLFYFFFAVLLYDLWILADILVCLAILGIIKTKKRQLKSKYFGTVLYSTDDDPG